MDVSFLLDTNVIIQFEETDEGRKIRTSFQQLHSSLVENRLSFCFHPLTEDDLKNDKDTSRLTEMLSRLGKYPKLDKPPTAQGAELEALFGGIKKANDLIDCQLLFAIKRNCTTYLVTEDQDLHKRARNHGLEDRVLYVQETIDLISRRFKPEAVQLPNADHEYVYNLDISTEFFDSLKADYSGFEDWIKKSCEKKRRCWTVKVSGELAGVCIYKHDDKVEHEGIPMPSMKLCTFKVEEKHGGRKFGELLMKSALQHAAKNKLASVWVTTHEKQEKLISFLKSFGFQVHSDLKGKDMIFYKLMSPPKDLPPMDPLEYHVKYFPHFYDHADIKKFVIPIQSQFHDILFPEVAPQPALSGLTVGTGIPGNTIRKVYLSHSKIKELPMGSLIFFYRSSPEQYIQTFGIIEKARRLTDMERLAVAIGKRSVYTREQVAEMVKKEVLVIDFRLIDHYGAPISLETLVEQNIFNARPPQSIMQLDHNKYLLLKQALQSH